MHFALGFFFICDGRNAFLAAPVIAIGFYGSVIQFWCITFRSLPAARRWKTEP